MTYTPKPLQWRKAGSTWRASNALGEWTAVFGGWDHRDRDCNLIAHGDSESLEHAKAAAETRYMDELLSMLEAAK